MCGSLGSVLRSKSRIGLKMGRRRSIRVKMISIIYISFFLVSSAHSIYLPDVAPRDFPTENLGEVLRGRREGVLVRWQLDTDNRLQLLEMSSMKMLRSISGIKLHSSVPERYNGQCSDVVFDSTAGLVSICIENYCVQFFSMLDDREISLVQVCERNHQPDDEVTVIVSMVALSPDGCTMSTVETRLSEEGIGGLVCLKFLKSGSQNKDFSLSTVVYEPHRDAGVSAIIFHLTRNMAVNSSYAAEFKIWACNSNVQHGDHMNNAGWTCRAVASYKKKPMTAAAFSCDGSVLAVAAERVITLWDPNRNVLVATIGEIFEPISSLSFIGKSGVE